MNKLQKCTQFDQTYAIIGRDTRPADYQEGRQPKSAFASESYECVSAATAVAHLRVSSGTPPAGETKRNSARIFTVIFHFQLRVSARAPRAVTRTADEGGRLIEANSKAPKKRHGKHG